MSYITDEMRDRREQQERARRDADAAAKQGIVDQFCWPENLDEIARSVEVRVRASFSSTGSVRSVMVPVTIEPELDGDAVCAAAVLERIRQDEPGASKVDVRYKDIDTRDPSRVVVTFDPPLR